MQAGGPDSKALNKLRGRMARGEGFVLLRLDGVVDEHNNLAAIGGELGSGGALVVDLGGVKRLNSVGVRDWVNWLRGLRARFEQIVLVDCPPAVMNEVNFVKNFAEGAHITSFGVPLYCALCKKEETRFLETASVRGSGRPALPSFACDKAGCQNAIDDDEESYFGFLESLPPLPDPAALSRLVALAREAGARAAAVGAASEVAPSPGRQPLAQLAPVNASGIRMAKAPSAGVSGIRTASPLPPSDTPPPPAPELPPAPRGKSDVLFVLAVTAMVAVLGVLVYLILTLE